MVYIVGNASSLQEPGKAYRVLEGCNAYKYATGQGQTLPLAIFVTCGGVLYKLYPENLILSIVWYVLLDSLWYGQVQFIQSPD